MAIDATAVARAVGVQGTYEPSANNSFFYLPQRIAVVGQGSTAVTYSTTKAQVTTAFEVGSTYGFGSPLHIAVRELLPNNGAGVGTIPVTVYPLDDDGSGVAAAGDITPSGAATGSASFVVKISEERSEPFTVASGDSVATIVTAMTAAINANVNMQMLATDNTTVLDLAAKWKGSSGNDLVIEVEATSEDNSGITFALTQPTGGLVNPDVDDALNQVGDVWETLFLNCMEFDDTTTFLDARWGSLSKRPGVAFTGNTETAVATAYGTSAGRKTDRSNAYLVAPASNNMPYQVAAAQLVDVAKVAQNNPARDYGSQTAPTITPGADGSQWNYTQRDTAVKNGCSTSIIRDNVLTMQDTVTFYHPDGDPTPAYRYVVDIVKLQQIYYQLNLEFATTKWDGAPLIPDNQATTEPTAKKPKDAKAAVFKVIDRLALKAIISDPDAAKATVTATINSGNPKRLDIVFNVALSGNANIIDVPFTFSFFFG